MEDESREEVARGAVTERGFRGLLERLSGTYNFDFREYKEASLARRIQARMSQVHVDSFEAYIQFLDTHPLEHIALFNTILINVTGFFRDAEAWTKLSDDVLPRVISDAADSRSIRIWSAGCSSGEEPYTLAILLAERLGERALDYMVKIYGTDIDEEALSTARHAVYRVDQLRDVPDALVARYFHREGQLYRLRRDLRRWCIFGSHNITQAPPLSHVDLLVCRNVLIYFTSELQERVMARFHYAIRHGGFLFLGRSESLLARSRLFAPVHLKWRIFQRTSAAAQQVAAVLPDRAEALAAERGARGDAAPATARLQRAIDTLPAGVILIDLSDTILTWNVAAEELFEIPVASAVARKFRDLDISYRVEGLRARVEEVKARHTALRMDDVTFTRRNGELTHANLSVFPLLEADRMTAILVFAAEGTEHARLKEQMTRIAEQHATAIEELQSTNEELETTNEELQSTNEELETTNEELQSTNEELETTVEELQATNAELAALNSELEQRTAELRDLNVRHHSFLDSLEQGILVLDRSGAIETWNQAAESMWGLRQEQVVGRQLTHLPLADRGSAARAACERVLATGEAADMPDIRYTLPGGELRYAHLRLTPLKDAAGEVTGVVGVVTPGQAPTRPARGGSA